MSEKHLLNLSLDMDVLCAVGEEMRQFFGSEVDLFVADLTGRVEDATICMSEGLEGRLVQLFVEHHGCTSSFNFYYPGVDWQRVRNLALARGHGV